MVLCSKRIILKDCFKVYRKDPEAGVLDRFWSCFVNTSGNQKPSNFRYQVAKFIYYTYMREHKDSDYELITWDPCMGWGGRLLGFLDAARHYEFEMNHMVYIGTDPNTYIFTKYKMVYEEWCKTIEPNCQADFYPVCCGSEDFNKSTKQRNLNPKELTADSLYGSDDNHERKPKNMALS